MNEDTVTIEEEIDLLSDEFYDFCDIDEVDDTCDHEWIYNEWHDVCIKCGQTRDLSTQFKDTEQTKKNPTYKRQKLFKEYLYNINCNNLPDPKIFFKIMEKLSGIDFKTIFELKRIMKDLKLFSQYKHCYYYYQKIKKIKLINLTVAEMNILIDNFDSISKLFNKNKENRKYLPSMNVVLFICMKRNKIDGYENIILPSNSNSLIAKIEKIIEL